MIESEHQWNINLKPVVVGFVLSLLCTFAAYLIVSTGILRPRLYLGAVLFLGILQTAFQFIFFFSLANEKNPRWNLIMFFFMGLVILLVVGGSVWIMDNLNYHMMPRMMKHE